MKQTALFFMLVLVSGCTLPGPSFADSTPPAQDLPLAGEATSTWKAESGCDNLYYPVTAGAYWQYSVHSSTIGNYDLTRVIHSVNESGFTVQSHDSSGTIVLDRWGCDSGDLRDLELPGGPAGAVAAAGVSGTLTSINNQGVTLPALIHAGDSWSQEMDLVGDIEIEGSLFPVTDASYTINYQAIGMEEVAVPAGSFLALRIEERLFYDMTVKIEGIEVPVQSGADLTLWYAPGVGLVRADSTNDLGGTEIIELVNYIFD